MVAAQGSWQAELRQYLKETVDRGRMTASCGELYLLFGNKIPLEAAARKWAAGREVTSWDSPDRMRFYTLTQYLHWLQCTFTTEGQEGRRKTMKTLIHIHPRKCACGANFVAEKNRRYCGSAACRKSAKGVDSGGA